MCMNKLRLISILAVLGIVALFVLRNPFRSGSSPAPIATTQADADIARSARDSAKEHVPAFSRTSSKNATQQAVPQRSAASSLDSGDAGPRATIVSALRTSTVDAIRSVTLQGEQKRKAMLAAIQSSGDSDEPWTAEAEDAFGRWQTAMPRGLRGKVSVADPQCYAAGCVAEVTFADAESHRAAAAAFRSLGEQSAGHGGRVQTPAEPRGTMLVASWIMLRPQDP
jgi:hypothetical protein